MRPALTVMLLGLVRDRGALAMTFVLPPVIFIIFAAVFASAGGEDLRIEVAIAATPSEQRVLAVLEAREAIERIGGPISEAEAETLVRDGAADVGLVLGAATITILENPARKVAASVLAGHLQDALIRIAPDNPLAEIRIDSRPVVGETEADSTVIYYAGAVAVLFLLFTAVQGAVSLLEDRESGIFERIVTAPAGIGALVTGKFLFIVLLGFLQVAVIFVVAWLGYGVPFLTHFPWWLVTTLLAATSAAGLALLLVASCGSRRQALTLGNFLVLILSAVGGSMVPRFLMPEWMQSAGWLTPNTWALEAYHGMFWRGEALDALWPTWLVLGGTGLLGLGATRLLARRFEHI